MSCTDRGRPIRAFSTTRPRRSRWRISRSRARAPSWGGTRSSARIPREDIDGDGQPDFVLLPGQDRWFRFTTLGDGQPGSQLAARAGLRGGADEAAARQRRPIRSDTARRPRLHRAWKYAGDRQRGRRPGHHGGRSIGLPGSARRSDRHPAGAAETGLPVAARRGCSGRADDSDRCERHAVLLGIELCNRPRALEDRQHGPGHQPAQGHQSGRFSRDPTCWA